MTGLAITKINIAKAIYTKNIRKRQRPIDYFNPQPYQTQFFLSKKKNKGVFGGNRSGKTISGIAYAIKDCLEKENRDWWAATWADMSTPVQQKGFYELLPKDKSIKYARFTEQRGFSNKIIMFENGSKIRFKTYDQGRESFQGAAKDGILLDEEPPEDITNECKARLIDRAGQLIRTMTPLDGITYTYDEMITNDLNNKEVEFWFWDNRDNKKIDQDSLQNIISQFSDKEAEVRQQGHFLNLTTGNVYYPFSEENIIESFNYMPNRPLEVSCDFNVDLMCWSIGQEHQGNDYEFDNVELEGQANTDLLCQMIKNKYSAHNGGFIFYGDISGTARRPETSRTNWAIIREHFPSAEIFYQNIKNIKDRTDSVNGRLRNNKGEIRAYIVKSQKRMIKDLRQVTWEHLLNKGKAGKLTHASDGLSYKFFWKHPLIGKPTGKQW